MRQIYDKCIYVNVKLKKCIEYIQAQNFEEAIISSAHIWIVISDMIKRMEELDPKQEIPMFEEKLVIHIINEIMKAKNNNNYIQVKDLIESQLQPIFISLQRELGLKAPITEPVFYNQNMENCMDYNPELANYIKEIPISIAEEFKFEEALSGNVILKRELKNQRTIHFHSIQDPWLEAQKFIDQCDNQNKERFLVFGLGWGFHIFELLDRYKEVIIFEADAALIRLWFEHRDIKGSIWGRGAQLIYDPDFKKLQMALGKLNREKDTFVIHYPSYINLQSEMIKFENMIKTERK
ncbi:hypothetical protein [Anaerosacchariphilus polymeriproducens]|uniref:DUF115 domain-containing protein n=1 Tax=Anaerosacchariphilus polymeriproducens TaxID=1812858 RepID=A0A371ATD0_9FIRM|nr:hypothetical protein [Anaerosacchariphilus polymeriproducens]RDU22799.1 hypothetical protein DWV06_12690 [Anaerosacchariphilus polymeriproducens]